MERVNGKSILLLGASKGHGKGLALHLARMGAKLILLDKDPKVFDLAKQLPSASVQAYQFDVAAFDHYESFFNSELRNLSLDALIYLPRSRETRDFLKTTFQEWDNDLSIGLKGAFFATQYLLPHLTRDRRQGYGNIIFFSSVLSRLVGEESVGYHLAKSGIEHLTRYLAVKLGPQKIRVNALQLGVCLKDQGEVDFEPNWDQGQKTFHTLTHALDAVGNSLDIAHWVSFLLREEARLVTGQVISLDGGLSLQEQYNLAEKARKIYSEK